MIVGEIKVGKDMLYPELEELKVTPTDQEQVFNKEEGYGYDNVIVEPIPSEYIKPEGTLDINENGEYDVSNYASTNVNVIGGGITPEGEINITDNGSYDVSNYATANVEIEKGITPTGELEIVENGTYDVTNYASANVNIEATGGKYAPTRISFQDYMFMSNEDGTDYDMRNEITNLDTSKVKSFSYSFSNIYGVPKLDLTSFDTSGCGDFTYMFNNSCFEYLDLSSFTFQSDEMIVQAGSMISDCYSLNTLVLGEGWLELASYNLESPEGFTPGGGGFGDIAIVPLISGTPINDGSGYIYVPNELVDQFKQHEVFMEYANQILPKSQLPTE